MSGRDRESYGLGRRLERAARAIAYLALSLPTAVLGTLAVLVLIVGAALSVTGIGLPLVLFAAAACRRLAALDRRIANSLLDTHVPPLPPSTERRRSPWRRTLGTLSDRQLWRVVALLAVKPLLIVVALAVALSPIVLLAAGIMLGIEGIAGVGNVDFVGPWPLNAATGFVLLLFTVPNAILAIAILDALRSVLCTVTRGLLAPRVAPAGPVRQMLAESIGDRSLSIAYWLPERGIFVDEQGHRVELPRAGSGRAWTAIEQDGRRVAAIVHDAALDTGPELVHAAAAAASLALDNERLKADLRARLEELRVSRQRIVEAGDAARRRLERNLHDGAQQQLVSLALDLHVLKARLAEDEKPMVDAVSEKLTAALAELRELARGIHPAVLTDRGLAPAVEALASRTPIPVEQTVDLDDRLPPPIEAAAYFLVAEALTNVSRYAQAASARVDIRRDGDAVAVLIEDDGVGGADPETGSGLRGLQDRLAALDGTLTVDSPPGEGTRVRGRIPCSPGPVAGGPAAAEREEQWA